MWRFEQRDRERGISPYLSPILHSTVVTSFASRNTALARTRTILTANARILNLLLSSAFIPRRFLRARHNSQPSPRGRQRSVVRETNTREHGRFHAIPRLTMTRVSRFELFTQREVLLTHASSALSRCPSTGEHINYAS